MKCKNIVKGLIGDVGAEFGRDSPIVSFDCFITLQLVDFRVSFAHCMDLADILEDIRGEMLSIIGGYFDLRSI